LYQIWVNMNNLVEIGQRLKEFLDYKKMKVNELGRMSDTSGTQIYNIVKGKKYGVDKFISVVSVLPELNIYWLLFGEGQMLKENLPRFNNTPSDESELLMKELENLKVLINYQEMTLNAYKRSLDLAASTNDDLKKMVEFYRTQAEGKSTTIKSA
jgi:hypothetical protein